MRMEPAADQIQNDPGERPRARPDRNLRCALALTAQADRCMLAMACCFDQRLHRLYISGVDLCNGGRCHSNTFWTALAHRQRVVSLGAQRSSCALRWTRTASPSAARSSTTASSWPTSSQRSQVRTRQRSIRVRVRVSGCQGVRVSGSGVRFQGSGWRGGRQHGQGRSVSCRAGCAPPLCTALPPGCRRHELYFGIALPCIGVIVADVSYIAGMADDGGLRGTCREGPEEHEVDGHLPAHVHETLRDPAARARHAAAHQSECCALCLNPRDGVVSRTATRSVHHG